MKAVVIAYEGRRPGSRELGEISSVFDLIANGDINVQVYTESSISKLLVENSIKPKMNVEDGNAAVTFIAGTVKKMDLPELSIAVIKNFSNESEDETNKAFKRAVAILANGAHVDVEVAKKYGFTSDVRDVITQLYRAWRNNE